jgi:hypothetical protein
MTSDSSSDVEEADLVSGDVRAISCGAMSRIIAHRADECARDLDRLMAHLPSDTKILVPARIFRGRDAITTIHQKSFDIFPKRKVDVRAGIPGSDPLL